MSVHPGESQFNMVEHNSLCHDNWEAKRKEDRKQLGSDRDLTLGHGSRDLLNITMPTSYL